MIPRTCSLCCANWLLSHFLHCGTSPPPLRYLQLETTQEEPQFYSRSELASLYPIVDLQITRAIMEDGGRKHSPNDSYPTPTSTLQASTERILKSHLPINTSEADYELKKNTHVQFIARVMLQGFPSKYISQDASQPWLMFWILESFSILQVGLDPGNKQRSARSSSHPTGSTNLRKRRAIDTVLACQHPDGGFGGGPAQSAHLLPTYAAVCALAITGRPGPGGGWDEIDRYVVYPSSTSAYHPRNNRL